jgi:WhiB family redox-sensing transcriptional regulator
VADVRRLPGQLTDHWDWQVVGACRNVDSTVFFHPHGERGAPRSTRDATAKALCARCPVIGECRTHALTVHEPYGVWGGLSAEDREEILHPHPRATTTMLRRP